MNPQTRDAIVYAASWTALILGTLAATASLIYMGLTFMWKFSG